MNARENENIEWDLLEKNPHQMTHAWNHSIKNTTIKSIQMHQFIKFYSFNNLNKIVYLYMQCKKHGGRLQCHKTGMPLPMVSQCQFTKTLAFRPPLIACE